MNILAFIPARGGSRRIPNKNIKKLAGKPLISYTIAAASRSKYINRIVVSTDSPRIAALARTAGAEVPFLRPKNIAGSHSTEMEFFTHALTWFKKNDNYEPDLIVLLYPTAPFRKTSSIDQAIRLMLANPQVDSLRSVKPCSEHPYKMWQISRDHYLKPLLKHKDTNVPTFSSQLFPKVYIQNANIYITKPATIWKKKSPIGNKVLPFIMSEAESVDINNPGDFKFAEYILREAK